MIWVIVILVVLLLPVQILSYLRLKELTTQVEKLTIVLRVRQSKVGKQLGILSGNPRVDARARTTVRDTDDLPLTGRMSTGIHRKRSDLDRVTNDDRL